MMTLGYLYGKFIKRLVRGKCVYQSQVDNKAKIYSGTQFHCSKLGRYSYVGYDCEIIQCEIGNFCSVANRVIIGGAMHPIDYVSTSPVFYNADSGTGRHLGSLNVEHTKTTHIGHDVWVGSRAIVLQGVTVGNGAVIGAGAVVTKDVPPYAIVAGCPARIIRYRFDEETIENLQQSEWWNIKDEQLKMYSKYMSNPQTFCNKLNIKTTAIRRGGGKLHVIQIVRLRAELVERKVAA